MVSSKIKWNDGKQIMFMHNFNVQDLVTKTKIITVSIIIYVIKNCTKQNIYFYSFFSYNLHSQLNVQSQSQFIKAHNLVSDFGLSLSQLLVILGNIPQEYQRYVQCHQLIMYIKSAMTQQVEKCAARLYKSTNSI